MFKAGLSCGNSLSIISSSEEHSSKLTIDVITLRKTPPTKPSSFHFKLFMSKSLSIVDESQMEAAIALDCVHRGEVSGRISLVTGRGGAVRIGEGRQVD